jgi:putative ABC transport system permease protein
MPDRRWRKVLRDTWLHRMRTLLVVLAIAIGLTGAGAILNTWALVERATGEGFLASNPASATIRTDSIDEALLERVRAHPAIRDVQARRTAIAAAQVQGAYRTAILYVMEDFTRITIGRLQPEVGAWPPADGDFVIERSSVAFSGAAVGSPLNMVVGKSDPRSLPVTGIVRDVGLAPGWMEHVVYGFVTPGTLRLLGIPSSMTELQIVVGDATLSQEEVRKIAWEVKAVVEGTGRRVNDVDVPVPGEHIHAAQMDSLLMTQGAFGLLALVVCAFLVVNLVAAMLAGQVREIGVMKAIGAQGGQIVRMYLVLALALGVFATAIAVPLALRIGRAYSELKAELLNFTIDQYSTPFWAIALQVVVGLLLPVVAAAFPVLKGCRIPVGAALRDTGMSGGAGRAPGALLRRIGGLSRPMLFSIRNAFRKRQRMVLTLLSLATGGAVFLGSRNLRASVIGSLDLMYDAQKYDFVLRFASPQLPDSIEGVISRIANVAGVEAWTGGRAGVRHPDGTIGNSFAIAAPPAASTLIAPDVETGRWLAAGDDAALVVNRAMLKAEPTLRPGQPVTLMIGGRETAWNIVGTVEAGPLPTVYAPRETMMRIAGERRVSSAMVASELEGIASQVDLIQRVRGELERSGMQVANSQLLEENRRVTEDHLLMVVEFLAVMGWVMIVVGGMGLASTMSLAVLERTREIGVLRAIGARHSSIMTMIQVEGLVIAGASWLVALPLSIPMSRLLGDAFGRVFMKLPVTYVPEAGGMLLWLGVVVGISLVACAWPAIRASRVTIASALSYE